MFVAATATEKGEEENEEEDEGKEECEHKLEDVCGVEAVGAEVWEVMRGEAGRRLEEEEEEELIRGEAGRELEVEE